METFRVVRLDATKYPFLVACVFLWLFSVNCDRCPNVDFIELYLKQCLPLRNVKQNCRLASSINQWRFADKQVLYDTFPIDPVQQNYIRHVQNVLFSVVHPTPFKTQSVLVAASSDCLIDLLNMEPEITASQDFVNFVSGSLLKPGATPLSHRYGGHQFGQWAGQLGDGRAVLLGEHVSCEGVRWELQLKGSGLTPYSRRGDGRAVLRSSVREFLCSEAMHYLGIPTSRAAALVLSNDPVVRDQFYTGHPQAERGAVVLRLAKSWFRIGTLELLSESGEINLLKSVVDFVIKSYFPSITDDRHKYLSFYNEVVTATAKLIAQWQSVGFTHGVCNTDNFSLLSITIDYGPFGFLDKYEPGFIPNTSDDEGMYSYEKQPDVGAFNLNKLRIALLPLLTNEDKSHAIIIHRGYADIYKSEFMKLFRNKLGLFNANEDDEQLVALLLRIMQDVGSDFTMTFRQLGEIALLDLEKGHIHEEFWALKGLLPHEWFNDWTRLYVQRLASSDVPDKKRHSLMNSVNPKYVLRNWMAQEAISLAERNNFEEVRRLARVLENPFTTQFDADDRGYSSRPPLWAETLKVSCSS